MTTGPRGRLIASTIATVQEHGVHAAGLSELLKRSNASRNSLYQHFPAGKGELVETAARIVSRVVYSHVSVAAEALAQAPSVSRWLDELFAFWRDPLESSEYREGSFMMAAALDELDPAVQAAAGQAFTEWTDRLAAGLVAAGAAPHAADALAGVLLSVIEGAILQSRALKSAHPFDDARTQLTLLLEHQLPPRPTHPHRDGITTAPDNPTPTAHGDDTPAHFLVLWGGGPGAAPGSRPGWPWADGLWTDRLQARWLGRRPWSMRRRTSERRTRMKAQTAAKTTPITKIEIWMKPPSRSNTCRPRLNGSAHDRRCRPAPRIISTARPTRHATDHQARPPPTDATTGSASRTVIASSTSAPAITPRRPFHGSAAGGGTS